MNYADPQFIAAVKKIVVGLLDSIRDSIQSLSDRLLQTQEQPTKENQNAKEDRQYPPSTRTELYIKPSERYKQEAKDTRESIVEFWKAYAEILGIFAVIAYTTFAALQWSEMKAANATAAEQIDAANRTAAAAENSVTELRKQTELSNRAWISPAVGHNPLKIGDPLSGRMQLRNPGKGPAHKISGYVTIKIYDMGELPSFKYGPHLPLNWVMSDVAFPNDPLTATISIFDYDTPNDLHKLTQDEVVGYNQGTKYVAIDGRIEYIDLLSKKTHFVQFCMTAYNKSIPRKVADACTAHYQIDSN